jgi:hypothetical protein
MGSCGTALIAWYTSSRGTPSASAHTAIASRAFSLTRPASTFHTRYATSRLPSPVRSGRVLHGSEAREALPTMPCVPSSVMVVSRHRVMRTSVVLWIDQVLERCDSALDHRPIELRPQVGRLSEIPHEDHSLGMDVFERRARQHAHLFRLIGVGQGEGCSLAQGEDSVSARSIHSAVSVRFHYLARWRTGDRTYSSLLTV